MINLEYMSWSFLIKKLLDDFRISVPDLENLTGLSNVMLYKILNGESKKPYQSSIKKIENALSIKIHDEDPENVWYEEISKADEHSGGRKYPVVGRIGANDNGTFRPAYEEGIESRGIEFDPETDIEITLTGEMTEGMEPFIMPGHRVIARVAAGDKLKANELILIEYRGKYLIRSYGPFPGYNDRFIPMTFLPWQLPGEPLRHEDCKLYRVRMIIR